MDRWDEEADVVVVGYGGAGAAAAIAAAERGADVLIVEKQPAGRHTPSTKMGGGALMAVTDVEKATRYLDRCAAGMVPTAVSRAWAERAVDVLAWLERVAEIRYVKSVGSEHPEFDGADAVHSYGPAEHGNVRYGHALFTQLAVAVDRRPRVRVRWDAPGRRLVRDGDRRVIGLEVADGRGVRRIGARKGVILTTGGYEYDEEMKLNYLKGYPIHFYGNPGNTGDGVRMAQDAGAALWHMNQMIGRAIAHFELPDGGSLNCLVLIGGTHDFSQPAGYVLTDRNGRRFANEHMQAMSRHDFYYLLLEYDPTTNDYPRNPCYWFFDERRMKVGPPVSTNMGAPAHGYYDWSPGSEREIANGWIKRGNTIEEVASLAGIADPARAVEEIAEYNAACAGGRDRFGRPAASLVPLDSPPFYCMPLYPGGSNTCGGPRRDEHARIVDVFGVPIEGLYGAGELGEPVGLMYPSNGANISDCMCFGQIAAEHATR